ncbi:MAG: AAA family ATPase [Fischerella sp.]|nr:AAA family ATPase [Fischerella sp.]
MTREQSMPHSSLKVNLQTETIGKLTVGNHTLEVGASYGAIAELATTQEQPILEERSTPIFIRHPPNNKLLEREESLKDAIAALESGQTVEFYSPAGFGKTFLLSCLEQELQANSTFADGVISLSPVHPYVGDLLQSIWEAFYESNIPYKPTDNQIRQKIQDKKALILLDDGNKLIQAELQQLRNATSNCTLLLASSKQRIYKQAYSIPLSGLSVQDALVFMEEKMQRSLRRDELPNARSLCIILNGHPMHIQLAIAHMLEKRRTFAEVVSQLPTCEPGRYIIQQILDSLTEPQRRVLALLALMDDAGLSQDAIATITQIPNTLEILENLLWRHLIRYEDCRYSVSKTIAEVLPPEWKLKVPLESAIAYYTNWAQQHQKHSKTLFSEADAIVQVLEVAVRSGRWQDVLRLVKLMESALALSKRWGLWEQVLQRGLQASQAERDKASEAWALHQLGTRALCLEEHNTALKYLTRAIELRESLNDETGVAVTRHNFNLLSSQEQHHFPSLSISQSQFLLEGSGESHNFQEKQKSPQHGITSQLIAQQTAPPSNLGSTKNGHQSGSNYQGSLKATKPLPPSSSPLLTRMNIVRKDPLPSSEHCQQKFLLSPKGVITTGIIASGGLIAWFNWHRFTPTPTQPATTKPQTITKPSVIPQPTATAKPSPIAAPTLIPTPKLSSFPQTTPKIDPALKPDFPEPTKVKPRRVKQSNSQPALPPPNYSPKPIDIPQTRPAAKATPTPTPEIEPPSSEISPTPTFTPVTPITPIPTLTPSSLIPRPTSKAQPTITPIEQPFNQQ